MCKGKQGYSIFVFKIVDFVLTAILTRDIELAILFI